MFPSSARLETLQKTIGDDLLTFAPELVVCTGIVALLLARLVPKFDRSHLGGMAIVFLAAALFAIGFQFTSEGPGAGSYFEGMLISDSFAGFVRGLVLLAALLTVLLTQITGIPDAIDSADFHVLLLGGTLGMLLMASANHLMMMFIAVEMASLPSYALAGFLKGKRSGSEASLKYVIYGAGASGVMLYGITLLAGSFGTGYLPDVAQAAARRGFDLPVLAGFGLMLVGLGFKLAAVPFHFWCPDVFEGAAAEVAGFLSVASKAAAVALTARILLTLQVHFQANPQAMQAHLWSVPKTLGLGVGVIAAITMTFGNLAAFGQTNLKRLLAYSTIAHAGYMLLAVSTVAAAGFSSILYYLIAYILMNLGAFAVVALVRNATRSEELPAYRGLVQRAPVLAVTMTVFLLSLLGLPPLAGFAGKFQVFDAAFNAAKLAAASHHMGLGSAFYVLLGIAAVNTAMSAYYYLKVVRMMLLESAGEELAAESSDIPAQGNIAVGPFATIYLSLLAVALFAAFILWDPITAASVRAVEGFGLSR